MIEERHTIVTHEQLDQMIRIEAIRMAREMTPPGVWWKIANEFSSESGTISLLAHRIYQGFLEELEKRKP